AAIAAFFLRLCLYCHASHFFRQASHFWATTSAAQPGCSPCSANKAKKAASSSTSTPRLWALVNLEPAFSPATRKSVLAETLPATLQPSCSSKALASSRLMPLATSVPVMTAVLPLNGKSSASTGSCSAQCTPARCSCSIMLRLCGSAKKLCTCAATTVPTSG